ncbi:MAG: tyrosine-type recombinase/integrase [Gammaproteobacteria bacterium]
MGERRQTAQKRRLLTEAACRSAKPKERLYRLYDERGLYLEIVPSGARYWRWKYHFGDKEKRLAFGKYPDVGIAEARRRRDDARAQLRDGIDPVMLRHQAKRLARERAVNNFEAVTLEWISKMRGSWTPGHADQVLRQLQADVLPHLGDKPIADIKPVDLLKVVRTIENREALDVASRIAQRIRKIFKYAILTGRIDKANPAAELSGVVKTRKPTHRAALAREELPEFMKRLATYNGRPETKLAIRLLMLTFVRTGELRGALWGEFDLTRNEWRIPAERMKMREPHSVPLARQTLEALAELKKITGEHALLLPSATDPRKSISENTILFTLYRMGYKGRATGHGFRALASTCLNELGFRADVIERQLAHGERNKVRAAYNRAQYLEERRGMMQTWADQLDILSKAADVVPLFRQKRRS